MTEYYLDLYKDPLTFKQRIKNDLDYLTELKEIELYNTMKDMYDVYTKAKNAGRDEIENTIDWLENTLHYDSCAQYIVGHYYVNNNRSFNGMLILNKSVNQNHPLAIRYSKKYVEKMEELTNNIRYIHNIEINFILGKLHNVGILFPQNILKSIKYYISCINTFQNNIKDDIFNVISCVISDIHTLIKENNKKKDIHRDFSMKNKHLNKVIFNKEPIHETVKYFYDVLESDMTLYNNLVQIHKSNHATKRIKRRIYKILKPWHEKVFNVIDIYIIPDLARIAMKYYNPII